MDMLMRVQNRNDIGATRKREGKIRIVRCKVDFAVDILPT
jgi:hypothetical protein